MPANDRPPPSKRSGKGGKPPAKPSGSGRPSSGRSSTSSTSRGGSGGSSRGSSDRRGKPAGRPSADEPPRSAGPATWGSLGRKGAARVDPANDGRNSPGGAGRDTRPNPGHETAKWERTDDVRGEAAGAVSRGRAPTTSDDLEPKPRRGRAPRTPGSGTAGADSRDELVRALGTTRGNRAALRVRDAAHAFERERFDETRQLLRPVAEAAPQASSVRELLGLTYYRLGRWNDAIKELEAFREQTRSTEQHPVLADCYRARKKWAKVDALWDELREASPSADLVAEGRIVEAGALADRGRLSDAVALLAAAHSQVKRPQIHHLRQAYVLADLYERSGDVARARELFRWVADHEPDFADAADRAASLT